MPRPAATRRADHWRDPHVLHSGAVVLAALLLSAGVLLLPYLRRVWAIARTAPASVPDCAHVLVFGKRLRDGAPDADFAARIERARRFSAIPGCTLWLLGGHTGGPCSEAAAAERVLRAAGIDAAATLRLEDASVDTLQNLRNARELIGAAAAAPVALVSSRYHLARCQLLARGLGFDAHACAAEDRLRLDPATVARLIGEAAYVMWLDVGLRYARLIRHEAMIARVT